MKRIFSMIPALVVAASVMAVEVPDPMARETIFQVATISALQESVYDGATTVAELKLRGDFGIGTFNALDGELIMLDGRVYRFASDGSVTEMSDSTLTPFASVTFFDPDVRRTVTAGTSYESLKAEIDSALPTLNLPYAFRIDGTFSRMKTRAPRRQTRPYPRLVDALANQPEFEYQDARGTLVGFRLPPYVSGINVPGWHLHFLSEDRAKAGHVLSFTVSDAQLAYDISPNLLMTLPMSGDFAGRDLMKATGEELQAIEGGR